MSDLDSATKRRKVRKGTKNCWECRRRKVRCIFSTPKNPVCNNCARRKTLCVSQEDCEPPSALTPTRNDQVEVRINRVEERVGRLGHTHNPGEADLSRPSPSSFENHSDFTALNSSSGCTPELEANISVPARSERQRQPASSGNKYEDLNRKFLAAWPSEHELELICALPVGLSSHLHCEMCRPNSSGDMHTADLLRLPPPGAHPVLFARKLLLLGTFLQGVIPSSTKDMQDRGLFHRPIMHRVVDTAIDLVTTKDELLGSIEAIECIALEAMYHNYTGNLHRAWMSTRRAIAVAQSMALHRGFASPSLRTLDPNTRSELDPSHLTFRLAEMDAYLSVMLGLQTSSLETRHLTSDTALAACTPSERMQRIHHIAQAHIIARSTSDTHDLASAHDIDLMLRKAAAEMSPQWWQPPNFASPDTTGGEGQESIMHSMIRTMDQFTHYHLLLRLHLPYLLRPSAPPHHHYTSKIVAVTTSRELLTRFLAFRASNPAHYYCRGSDFLAFIATTVLCVAHITNHGSVGCGEGSEGFAFLAHSRMSDRGLMERALDVVETTHGAPGTDAIASKISRIVRDLLVIEANAAGGTLYSATSCEARDEELECEGKMVDEGRSMRVHVPHFGSIDFVKGRVERGPDASRTSVSHAADKGAHGLAFDFEQGGQSLDGEEFAWDGGEWDLQGVDIALFDSLFGGAEGHNEVHWDHYR
ncbi:hypothetical protein BU23DRAFT_557519 [Bimuria novae-zelandiae CBS 107.79]|uniref:Zn(2)-C6 fungal-type domain-containing protein n=1 Tax=Bimuria novae-zelandiae CBS 107.79 TaxID=1447943 RepID=A0A6A5V8R0_9PLEO|nr:hypothetical protein BU23DRAFT_557519 [Bimuria novae-zelandiae CBS 107.79]